MTQTSQTHPRLIPTLRDDLSRAGFFGSMKREAREIEEFFLSDDERDRLRAKGKIWRWFVLAWWVLKNSILKLTSFRRIVLVAGLLFIFVNVNIEGGNSGLSIDYTSLGVLCLLLVIILELKDKLLAHDELESGRAVQSAMNPKTTPFIPGWNLWLYTRPANEVGGDLVDFLKCDENRFGVAIGDVAGKGLGAALFMVKIQSTLRALAPDSQSLRGLAAKLNMILMRDGMPGKFASLVYVSFTSASGDLRFFNAGHMPPLVVSPDGVKELPKGSGALGLSGETEFSEQEFQLSPGQSLVIYSDGLTEAQNEAKEFYGLERFKTLCTECHSLTAQSFGEQIVSRVTAFEGEARRTDDLSLVILQRSV
jgi:hypothetical protein